MDNLKGDGGDAAETAAANAPQTGTSSFQSDIHQVTRLC